MKAREFHATPIGAKVRSCIGASPHIAKVIGKDTQRRKFLLRYHLASGDSREEWRTALRCAPVPADTPMGHCGR